MFLLAAVAPLGQNLLQPGSVSAALLQFRAKAARKEQKKMKAKKPP